LFVLLTGFIGVEGEGACGGGEEKCRRGDRMSRKERYDL